MIERSKKRISIQEAKKIRDSLGLTHLVLFGVSEEGTQHVVTHGKSVAQSKQAADAGNRLKGLLGWPENLQKDTPLKRVCSNCVFFLPDYQDMSLMVWERFGCKGSCMVNPVPTPRGGRDPACKEFEPKS